ncbi:mismatch-specific DNA-glycosylase [Frateuria sp. STR12]|uniref:mismatch-specific DNA-glycosylase n=1 Tax=Frateuria hangzhouensis TaxID=2995589 RepID=UPI002260C063|nr:mismatch-specific DNA-glycosylase [Frateuria sp. STR12]MCX7513817.1 mismatch-specific DNA-glycosylase [Frateuria sp. STR12]
MNLPAEPHILPDLLRPGLALVFCGTAAGERSARDGAYYAHPGNLFWRALHEAGLTPRRFAPAEFPQLLERGIGLTDLAKRHSGNDADLPRDAFDVPALVAKIDAFQPRLLAFTSKAAARAALGRAIVAYGPQPERLGNAQVYALPSPSGQARRHWAIEPWRQLAFQFHEMRAC